LRVKELRCRVKDTGDTSFGEQQFPLIV